MNDTIAGAGDARHSSLDERDRSNLLEASKPKDKGTACMKRSSSKLVILIL